MILNASIKPRKFDESAYRAAFRARAAALGIDPAVGATSYQVAAVKAEIEIAKQRSARDRDWWLNASLWEDVGKMDSTTEREALQNIMSACRSLPRDLVVIDMATTRELWSEVKAESKLTTNLHKTYTRHVPLQSCTLTR